MKYSEITSKEYTEWLELGFKLWPEESKEGIVKYFEDILVSEKQIAFCTRDDENTMIAFINLSLRHDYVEGSDSSPVGYIEGVYVEEKYRHQGIARELVSLGEEWAKGHSCIEFASDVYPENTESRKFHESIGFEGREIVVYIKKIL